MRSSSSSSPFEFSSLHASSSSSSSPKKSPKKPTPPPAPRTHRPASIHSNPRPKSMDMSRLLEPAYLPSSSRAHHASSPSHVSAFIDTNGDAHDPDYRHFPISPSARRRASRHSTAAGHNSGHKSGYYYNNYGSNSAENRRPAWWSDDDEAVLSEYEDGEGEGEDDEDEGDSEPFFLSSGPHPQNGARYKAGGAAAYRRRRRSLPGGGYSGSAYSGSGYGGSYGGSGYGGSAYGGSAYGGSAYGGSGAVYERGQSTTMSMRGSPTLCGRKRDGSFSTSTTTASAASSAAAAAAYYAGHSPATTASTLPTSWESDKGVLGRLWRGGRAQEEGGDDEKVKEKEKEGCVMKKIRRLSRGDREKEKEKEETQHVPSVYRASDDFAYGSSRPLPIAEEKAGSKNGTSDVVVDEEEEEEEEEERRQRKEREEYVPTCGQSMRRQWAAISLSLRFSLFRAQRRISRRVNSLR